MLPRLAKLTVLLAMLVAAPARAADDRMIGAGVTVRGIDVSNRTVDQAAAELGAALTAHLMRGIVVEIGAGDYRLTAKQAKLGFDPQLTAVRAYRAGAERPDQNVPVDVAPALRHSVRAVRAWAFRLRKRVTRPGRNATVRITLRHIFRRHSSPGLSIDARALAKAIDTALDDSRAPRKFRQPMIRVAPKVTAADLPRRYGTIITIDRAHFTLRLFKRLKISKRYGIAVGMAGLDTPSGQYAIQNKQINPAWHVPNSAWAGSLAGQVIPGGAPNNPLKARWLGVAAGVGIHGTAEEWSIGSRASHGCIRMRVGEVVDLFRRVPVGTPVLIR
jgi:lipoprotein-anchoring transpeptidase ErfK/SrfK